jgi:hypothetical protein
MCSPLRNHLFSERLLAFVFIPAMQPLTAVHASGFLEHESGLTITRKVMPTSLRASVLSLYIMSRLALFDGKSSGEGRWRKCWNNFLRVYFWILSCLIAHQLFKRGSLRAIKTISQLVQPVEALLRVS